MCVYLFVSPPLCQLCSITLHEWSNYSSCIRMPKKRTFFASNNIDGDMPVMRLDLQTDKNYLLGYPRSPRMSIGSLRVSMEWILEGWTPSELRNLLLAVDLWLSWLLRLDYLVRSTIRWQVLSRNLTSWFTRSVNVYWYEKYWVLAMESNNEVTWWLLGEKEERDYRELET